MLWLMFIANLSKAYDVSAKVGTLRNYFKMRDGRTHQRVETAFEEATIGHR